MKRRRLTSKKEVKVEKPKKAIPKKAVKNNQIKDKGYPISILGYPFMLKV